jgi:hypothetical protein
VRRGAWIGALVASAVLLAVRIHAAGRVGFGDAEALYACYAWHPQPVYLDHPGLIGVVARMIGRGSPPSPLATHIVTAVLATLAPWLAAVAARAAGASKNACGAAALALLLAPEISVGLFGFTPDLLLVLLWYASVAASLWALGGRAGSLRTLVGALGSGLAAGLACDAKASGVLLLAGLVLGWSAQQAASHRRTLAPWAGVAVALLVFSPVVLDEAARDFPMLRHRLIDTQKDAGLSLRNVGALLGGQLLYVTPPLLVGAFVVACDLHRQRDRDATSKLLWSLTIASLPLVLLCCLSRVAEPHWVAPLYLALPLHFARRSVDALTTEKGHLTLPKEPLLRRGLIRSAVATGAIAIALAHAWVLLPIGPRLLGKNYVPRYDLSNDLYAWEAGLPVLRNALASARGAGVPAFVVGPHWTVCAQVHAALPASVLVGCQGDIPDDFSRWLPASTWQRAPVLFHVTDDRFEPPPRAWPNWRLDGAWSANVLRGDAVVRRIVIRRLVASAVAGALPLQP